MNQNNKIRPYYEKELMNEHGMFQTITKKGLEHPPTLEMVAKWYKHSILVMLETSNNVRDIAQLFGLRQE